MLLCQGSVALFLCNWSKWWYIIQLYLTPMDNTQATLNCTSMVFCKHHHTPLWKSVLKQRSTMMGRRSLKTGHRKVQNTSLPLLQEHVGKRHPSLQYLLWGTSIISGGPSGQSVIHPPGKWHSGFKWDKTFASGISISKLNMHMGPCGDGMLD